MSSMEICALEISIKEVLPAIKANCYRWSVMSLLLKNGRIRDKWILVYGAIERCNDVLRMLNDNKIDGLSEESEMEIRAEARFLRGYYHFEAKKSGTWSLILMNT